jgi:hypothetical protein
LTSDFDCSITSLEKPACTPSIDWWIVVAVIYPLVQRVETTVVKIQGMNTLMCEQKSQLSRLVYDMQARTNVEGVMTAQDRARFFPPTVEQLLLSDFFYYNSYYVTRVKTAETIVEAGMMVQTELDQLKEDGGIETGSPYHGVLKTPFALTVVGSVSIIVAEQGVVEEDAGRVVDEIPPVLPVDLCSMTTCAFSAVLQKQRDRLLQKVSDEDVENVDAQFRRLASVYAVSYPIGSNSGFFDILILLTTALVLDTAVFKHERHTMYYSTTYH